MQKEISCSCLVSDEVYLKKNRVFFLDIGMAFSWLSYCAKQGCLLISISMWTPFAQTRACKDWLNLCARKYSRLVSDKVLLKNYGSCSRNFTSNIIVSCKVLAIFRYMGLFPEIDVSMRARPISWLDLRDRKYSFLVSDEIFLKYYEPF